MSNTLQPARSQKRFSREGFKPLPNQHQSDMASRNDIEQGIPLQQVTSNGAGLRHQTSMSALRPTQSTATATNSDKRRFLRGRRQKSGNSAQKTGNVGYDGEEDTITTMGKIYNKVLNFSIVTRYFLYVSPLALMIAVPIIVGATAAKDASIAGVPIVWFFTWVEIVWLSLWVSKIVAHFLPFVFQIFAGVVSSGVRKYSMVIRALEIPLSLVGWAVTSLATFMPLMTRNPTLRNEADSHPNAVPKATAAKQWENIVQSILAAAVVASLIFLAEKFIIQLISINYHRKQFNARIRESKRNIRLVGELYEASRVLFPQYCDEFAEEDYLIADQLNISSGLGSPGKRPAHHRSGSATPMRLIQNVGRYGDKLTSAFGNVAHEITGRDVFNPNSSHSIVVEALEKTRTSEALARRIWMSFVVEGRDALTHEDIADVLGEDHKDDADESFAVLDRDANGDVSLDEMILTVTEMGRERKAIASSMHDVDQAINVLDRLLILVVFVAIVFVFVAFLNQNFTTTLATTGTALLSLSFVFATSCQEVLGSCIFLFVKHPYDIGDRIEISNVGASTPDSAFVVEHISLLFTVFRHVQGPSCGRLCQIPNIVLNTLWIENTSRSKAMTEQLTIDVSFGTSFDDLQILKNELLKFVTDKDNSRDFQATVDLDVLGSSDQSKLSLMVEIKHKSNWANETVRRARRSKFMCALVAALKIVPVYAPGGGIDVAGSPANPNYSVAISTAEAKENAAGTKQSREDARLVPLKKIEAAKQAAEPPSPRENESSAPFLTLHEQQIADDLTSRNPASDPTRDEAWTSSREDSSTLGERPSIDRQDLEDVRGLLRRESTKGKRKPYSDYNRTVPTIYEPGQSSTYNDYAQQGQFAGYENQRPAAFSTMPAAYRPPVRAQNLPSQPPQSPLPTLPGQPVEMSQVPAVTRSPSNPYRNQSESMTHSVLALPGRNGEEEDDFDNARPYSGV